MSPQRADESSAAFARDRRRLVGALALGVVVTACSQGEDLSTPSADGASDVKPVDGLVQGATLTETGPALVAVQLPSRTEATTGPGSVDDGMDIVPVGTGFHLYVGRAPAQGPGRPGHDPHLHPGRTTGPGPLIGP
jgi:hypothetical protein